MGLLVDIHPSAITGALLLVGVGTALARTPRTRSKPNAPGWRNTPIDKEMTNGCDLRPVASSEPVAESTAGVPSATRCNPACPIRTSNGTDGGTAQSETNFRLLFSANPLPMWVCDRATLSFLEVNDAAVRHYGYTRQEFLGMLLTDIRPREHVERLLANVANVTREWSRSPGWKHVLKSGQVIDVEVASAAVTFKGHEAVMVVAQDVTQRSVLEAQLRQTQKLEAIGQLAGGVAHDLNNVLTAILGFTELAMSSLPSTHDVQSLLMEIQHAGERAASLTAQLLAFGRKQLLQPRVLDINELIRNMQPMLRRLIFEHVQLSITLPSDVRPVAIDPTQLEQILINLAVNAGDAMPRGGTLTIETSNVVLDASYEQKHLPITPGEYVMLTVRDTGVGMDASVCARIFEPFFTTKAVGKGTGLGLPTVYGIVKQSGGDISVHSEPGSGTTFEIYLPQTKGPLETLASNVADENAARGSETILLVEDDEAVRLLALMALQEAGYRVRQACSPREALALVATGDEPVHLLLSDVIMPESEGPPLFQTLARTRPGLRVLYVSGYADDAIREQGIVPHRMPFLQKPFTPQILVRKVREVLDAPPLSAAAGSGRMATLVEP